MSQRFGLSADGGRGGKAATTSMVGAARRRLSSWLRPITWKGKSECRSDSDCRRTAVAAAKPPRPRWSAPQDDASALGYAPSLGRVSRNVAAIRIVGGRRSRRQSRHDLDGRRRKTTPQLLATPHHLEG